MLDGVSCSVTTIGLKICYVIFRPIEAAEQLTPSSTRNFNYFPEGSIEYDKVDIGTISVEIKHAGKIFDGTREDIKELLGNNGYAFVTSVHIDDIFTKKKCPTCISKQSLELY